MAYDYDQLLKFTVLFAIVSVVMAICHSWRDI